MGSPTPPVEIPRLSALDKKEVSIHTDNERVRTLTTSTSGNTLVLIQKPNPHGKDAGELAYRTADGRTYRFGNFTNPMIPDGFSPNWRFPTTQHGQTLDNGGKLLVCCTGTGQNRYMSATDADSLRFGAWVSPQGTADLFVGGKVADPAYMPGGSHETAGKIKGKATYEVLALRVRNGRFVNSSYTPKYGYDNAKGEPVLSLITANFNTNKMGGTIVGNSDFGPDVVLKDVNIQGNAFSGSAESGGQAGKVNGLFFGEPNVSWTGSIRGPATGEIGGTITFDKDKSLDTVFGGTRIGENQKDLSDSLEPVK